MGSLLLEKKLKVCFNPFHLKSILFAHQPIALLDPFGAYFIVWRFCTGALLIQFPT